MAEDAATPVIPLHASSVCCSPGNRRNHAMRSVLVTCMVRISSPTYTDTYVDALTHGAPPFSDRLPTRGWPFCPKALSFSEIMWPPWDRCAFDASYIGELRCPIRFYPLCWCSRVNFPISGCCFALMWHGNHQESCVLHPDWRSRRVGRGHGCDEHLGNSWGESCTKHI